METSLFTPMDNYCERMGEGLLAEPMNAATNAAFFIAAFLLWRRYRAQGAQDAALLGLIVLIALIGAGSLSFHTFANRLTMLADVIPISLFVFAYLWVALRRLLGLSQVLAAIGLGGFALLSWAVALLPAGLQFNGSVSYFPCLAALIAIAFLVRKTAPQIAKTLAMAAACFAASLTLRTWDAALCESFALGTHFFWHIFNGIVLYLLGMSLLQSSRRR